MKSDITNEDCATPFKNFVNLKFPDLSGTENLSMVSLKGLTKLKKLSLEGLSIQNKDIEVLKDYKNLEIVK